MRRITLLFATVVACSAIAFAQSNFLLDTYIEVGISDCGTHIGDVAPSASNANAPIIDPRLGIVADPEQDGWATGTTSDYCGDYVMPGSPVEGFALEYGASYYNNEGDCGAFAIPEIIGSNVDAFSNASLSGSLWKGSTPDGVDVRQFTLVADGSRSIIHQVKLYNNTGADISNMYYMRNADPDNDQPWSGSFVTENGVEIPSFGDGAAAVARGTGAVKCELLLLTADDRATASYGSFFAGFPSDAIAGNPPYMLSGTASADQAIQLSWDLGAVDDGDNACFSFAYVADREEGIAAWKATKIACNNEADEAITEGDMDRLSELIFSSSTPDLKAAIAAYPNPANGEFFVDLRGIDPAGTVINVYNSMGSLMFSRTGDMSLQPIQHNLPAGVYIIQVEADGVQHSTRIAIN